MSVYSLVLWIPLIPFIIFLINGIFSRKIPAGFAGILGTLGLGASTLISYVIAYNYFFVDGLKGGVWSTIMPFNLRWLQFTEKLVFDMGALLDPISVMMLVVVSTVSLMVHIYSLGYMKGEDGFARYYAFLSLFSFSMYGLVIATNLFQIYFFWELVGVSSFLLIGFYYKRPSAVAAAKKAFIVTRFADFGFLVGILLISYFSGTFDFGILTDPEGAAVTQASAASFMGMSALTWGLLLVFAGGAGKSAMFPFHIWLPDAMEGPTPVSALIHAATMVVAGVYLVARLFPLFELSGHTALEVIAFIGAFTSLFTALIAMTQQDIKRILAYSTISQIGYMMLALGISGYEGHEGLGYTSSMFHLFTHAMFKALLFLGAGAIIHAVHSNVMKDMGNLRKYLPITHITFLVACLAIAGIPPFAGFFSKDEILAAVHEHHPVYYFIATFVAGLTAFYMFRLYFKVFWGKKTEYKTKPHEAPYTMTIPLIILGIFSAVAGFIPFGHFVSPDRIPMETEIHMSVAVISVLVALSGIIIAWIFYKKESPVPARINTSLGSLYRWVEDKFYIDEVYSFVTQKILFNGISRPVAWFDRHVVDATMNLIGNATKSFSSFLKVMQSGKSYDYAMAIVAGAIVIALLLLL